MADKEIRAGSFEAARVGGHKGGNRILGFDGFDECGHKLSIGWCAGLTVIPEVCYSETVGW